MAKYVSENGIKAIRDWTKAHDNKSLYNLGAYDTISGNVITRQTGYLVLDGVKHKFTKNYSPNNNGMFGNFDLKEYALIPSSSDVVADVICNRFGTYTGNDIYSSNIYGISITGDGTLAVGLTKAITTLEEANAYLVQNPISIQYKLATPYTEEIIEGQPLITLDSQGSQWLRDEWGKGLNLWDEQWEVGSIDSSNGNNLNASDRMRSKNYIKVSTYTLYITIENFSNVFCYDNNKSFLGVATYTIKGVGYILYLKNNTSYIRFNTNTTYGATYKNDIAIFEGDHPYPYQPYEGEIVHDKDIEDLYKQEYNLGYYDTMVENSDGRYTITRQTGYLDLDKLHWIYDPNNNQFYSNEIDNAYSENNTWTPVVCDKYTFNIVDYNDLPTPHIRGFFDKRLYVVDETLNRNGELITGVVQYKLATATTEKVEKNHYARYNQRFILEHNKSEAERSANLISDKVVKLVNKWYYNGNLVSGNDPYYTFDKFPIEPNTTYSSANLYRVSFWDTNKNYINQLDNTTTFTTPSNCRYITLQYNNEILTPMLNKGSVALPYQPYEGKTIHEKDLENTKTEINNSIATKQDKLVSNSNIKTINGNSILGSGDLTVTADSVFTEVTDVIDSFIINRNGTWLITCLGYNKIYASDNSTISFYGSALVSMTSVGSDPHICINGTAYACSSAITFVTSGIMQVYKKAN